MDEQMRIVYSVEYLDYLDSNKWRVLRAARLKIDGGRCAMCGTPGSKDNPLDCHHFGYKKPFGNEDVWTDLVTLCRQCHDSVHRMMNRVTSADGRRGWASEFYVPEYNSTNKDEKTGEWKL